MNITILNVVAFRNLMRARNITSDNVESFERFCFISINNPLDEKVYFESDKANVKVLYFDDIETDGIEIKILGKDETCFAVGFSSEQADALIEFIEANKDKANCIIHCTAGISRSGAVGTFINKHYCYDSSWFYTKHPHIQPNKRVLGLLEIALLDFIQKNYE